jgi:hypothetical protein
MRFFARPKRAMSAQSNIVYKRETFYWTHAIDARRGDAGV